ncbi:MAG: polyisoprenoid-binding protein [Alphaproteobacteria bacterium]|nr:MAG: polyisoprenoid-binding protein [Alphaproteobacteria bacterium]
MARIKTLFLSLFMLLPAAAVSAAPVEYVMDKAHTHIGLTWNHLGFSDFRARFRDFDGTLVLDPEAPENSRVEVTIPLDSIDTNVPRLDEHLKSADFFDVAKYPVATFRSTRIERTGEKTARLHGELTLHGVTRPVVLDVRLNGMGEHPLTHKPSVGFTAEGVVKRSEFGLTAYVPMVSDEVHLFISTEASVK